MRCPPCHVLLRPLLLIRRSAQLLPRTARGLAHIASDVSSAHIHARCLTSPRFQNFPPEFQASSSTAFEPLRHHSAPVPPHRLALSTRFFREWIHPLKLPQDALQRCVRPLFPTDVPVPTSPDPTSPWPTDTALPSWNVTMLGQRFFELQLTLHTAFKPPASSSRLHSTKLLQNYLVHRQVHQYIHITTGHALAEEYARMVRQLELQVSTHHAKSLLVAHRPPPPSLQQRATVRALHHLVGELVLAHGTTPTADDFITPTLLNGSTGLLFFADNYRGGKSGKYQ